MPITPDADRKAALVLADGMVFRGHGFGRRGAVVGEVVFNTAMTGYQEILSDPSYAGQLITFTFPHIGNVGTNDEDVEAGACHARGFVLRAPISDPANYRAALHLDRWLERQGLVGIGGIDTRRLTRHLRDHGAQPAALGFDPENGPDIDALADMAKAWPGLEGMDLASEVTCRQRYRWDETVWRHGEGYGQRREARHHVVAIDFGIKRNILRSLAARDIELTVMPATTPADDILALSPDGIFLSNGPGDPAATGRFAVPEIKKLVASGKPVFGICLGHQMLALALGATTEKMKFGHHGANHPVKDLATGKVEITSQNHGFSVDKDSLPEGVEMTHVSLFDGSLEGLALRDRPVFSVQYHPEAAPGPEDSAYLFDRFLQLMARG
ncbi:MAG: glutamine-hydrolyzing carbamoyl-phosphate synthase small subunit [Alphaproteobacteria bacterium]|nr:glutamine-hydrolyzing carbamoyl-phosphate synthase small subunit [Alphaproteobacteria bacterium]